MCTGAGQCTQVDWSPRPMTRKPAAEKGAGILAWGLNWGRVVRTTQKTFGKKWFRDIGVAGFANAHTLAKWRRRLRKIIRRLKPEGESEGRVQREIIFAGRIRDTLVILSHADWKLPDWKLPTVSILKTANCMLMTSHVTSFVWSDSCENGITREKSLLQAQSNYLFQNIAGSRAILQVWTNM